MQALFGGSSGSQQSSSASGYSALPSQLQTPFNALGTQVGALTNPSNPGVTQMFTPSAMTPGETTAAANINTGFAPTASSINTDMNMQMNPYIQSVIGGVNQNANAADSVFNQSLANAGVGPDSSTSILGANNIQQTENNTIGTLLSNQFNTAMNNSLTTIPQANASDAAMQMQLGQYQQTQANAAQLAPISALMAGTGMIAPFTAGGTSSGSGSSSSNGSIFGQLSAASNAAPAASLFAF